MANLYGLVLGIPEQKEIISKHCFGTCGKIILGAVLDEQMGELAVCRTAKKKCPQLDKQMDEPIGEVKDEPLYLRKLKLGKEK
jgi:hypothetical protein